MRVCVTSVLSYVQFPDQTLGTSTRSGPLVKQGSDYFRGWGLGKGELWGP